MVEVQIDGISVQVAEGSMVMDAASKLDIYVPHFCYHKKLSIAANCRMCLVEVEKAPKPLPACATPVTAGMIVRTQSAKAKQAQKSVMEFLLINHPLDCPICDQGGECQLQDLAVGYGGSTSRYDEPKRVVFHKNIGPLIAAEEMTRCIQCTRCVRFGQEVAGVMELGMAGRGEHSEILSFVGNSVDSEISGNMIDICPVGALTSKPFRYEARTWELSRRKSVSPHDSLGSNLIVQVKNQRVMRVLPLENEDINECWLSDRDRFSYEGLNAPDRLQRPMIKQNGNWQEVDWPDALAYVAHALTHVKSEHGAEAIGALAGPNSTAEELFLLGKLMRELGSDNVDFRLRQSDFSADGKRAGAPWLGMSVAEFGKLDRMLVIGSSLRKDHPLLAARVRRAAKRGCRIIVLNAIDDDWLMPIAGKAIVRPAEWLSTLQSISDALTALQEKREPDANARKDVQAIASSLAGGSKVGIVLGNSAMQSPHAAQLQALALTLARQTNGRVCVLTESANTLAGHLVRATPQAGGLNARKMMEEPRSAYLLWNLEPEYDTANSAATMRALGGAETVIAFSPYRNGALEYADAILPIGPFTETSGSYVSAEGRLQSFNAAVQPLGESRPGWKVLRVLANMLELGGFDYENSEQIRAEALPTDIGAHLSNDLELQPLAAAPAEGVERFADVPLYFTDAIVRRSAPLQATRDARPPKASGNAKTLAGFGVTVGSKARVIQGGSSALLDVVLDERLPDGVLRVPAGHASTATLGAMFGPIRLERA